VLPGTLHRTLTAVASVKRLSILWSRQLETAHYKTRALTF